MAERVSNILAGRKIVVSGIGPGLGRRAAVALASHGADLALGARRQGNLDEVAEEVAAYGGKVITRSTDITKVDQCEALFAAANAELGGVDGLVNNAYRYDVFQPFESVDLEQWSKIIETNVMGSLRMVRSALPYLRAAGGGSVVNVASMVARKPQPLQGGYATSKGALLTATRVLAFELGPDQIRVNAVVPGWMAGPSVDIYLQMTAQARGITEAEVLAEIEEPVALGHIPSDEDVAGSIVYLISDLSKAVTGQAIDTNGGELFVS